jgi:hypothetical protein
MKVNPQIGLKVPISNRIPALAADRHAGPGGGRKRLLPEAQDVEVVAFDLVCPCDEIGNIVHDVKEPARQAGLLFRVMAKTEVRISFVSAGGFWSSARADRQLLRRASGRHKAAPARGRGLAITRPMPRLPPVTTAPLLSKPPPSHGSYEQVDLTRDR